MEGPTPVSALIHAATMVTAGIFLLLRCTYILKYTSFCLLIIIFLGGITAFVSATIGLFQNDITERHFNCQTTQIMDCFARTCPATKTL